jgi:type II secretory pathway pseudopilin PulG
LLVVIAIIAILAALLLPSLNSAKRKASQVACINNQKQLGLGMEIYVSDNDNTFPGIASRMYGFQRVDWIYWRTNTALYPTVAKSPILTELAGAKPSIFRCPLDTSDNDRDRLAQNYSDGYGPYLFSYSMTGYGLDDNGNNLGTSTVVDSSGGTAVVHPFKESSVRNPSAKILLAEEPGALNKQDKQIADWREYMRLNPTQFRRKLAKLCQTKDLLQSPEPDVEPCTYSNHRLKDPESFMWEHFWIISGRRQNLSPSIRALMARQQHESKVFMASYDGFIDVAKRLA